MNDMLQHQEFYSQEIRRHQAESQRWAQAGMLGRLSAGVRDRSSEHPRGARFLAITTPTAIIIGVLAIII